MVAVKILLGAGVRAPEGSARPDATSILAIRGIPCGHGARDVPLAPTERGCPKVEDPPLEERVRGRRSAWADAQSSTSGECSQLAVASICLARNCRSSNFGWLGFDGVAWQWVRFVRMPIDDT
jgi:hypothetical protein